MLNKDGDAQIGECGPILLNRWRDREILLKSFGPAQRTQNDERRKHE
jgi:hypothetical protein